ncbi:N-acetylglucosamine-1-phosphotransferase subunits alpha/beta-like isoform X2 [Gigantopelta aegis]|uniref:N-acetylglucosamine-1-phosphotransferase subunits alpha/beta-like isoform X2 n=1 Tax=Gigantopelta aegis TaxID=1735272 RepID=UPI001B88CE88|nr:N-acetylglucosamine-1-phosphotransferase subunits alpha/beta-like isoform X2 [Gigantopelta aegis]
MESSYRKIFQKNIYDILSHKYGLLLVVIGLFLLALSALHFGETALEWSREKYAAVFNSYSDNIGGRSFRQRLCLPVPIDIVYTWVNGSDPDLIIQLRQVKVDLEQELNVSREEKCSFSNCLPTTKVVLNPALPPSMNLTQFTSAFPAFSEVKAMYVVTSPADAKLNFTVLVFDNETLVNKVVNMDIVVQGNKTAVKRAYITSDWTVQHTILLHDVIIMSGFPHELDVDNLRQKLPEKFHTAITKIDLHTDRGIAVLYVPKKEEFEELVDIKNFTIDGKEPTLNAANLIWELKDFSQNEDVSSSRFEDNEELRYSLRSIEKFAPWVRHIYIVTNGQIPYWLDLENPRVSIVTHQEIFSNTSHLPTFSSPAIEAHLHKIAGLSDKFIYLNDDVMFGKEVWPDDFFSFSTGQKVYLTWPVPNCNEGCPSTWIKDGYCDKACNNSECEWDAGDCDGTQRNIQLGAGYHNHLSDSRIQALAYCNPGCANSWIADKYCDTACNVLECGFDAGDCGVDHYDKLYGLDFSLNKTHYNLPPGVNMAFFNLTDVLGKHGMITQASYNDSRVYRQVAVSNKFKVMTLVLQSGHNLTTLVFNISGHQGSTNQTFQVAFTVSVDTNQTKSADLAVSGKTGNDSKLVRADEDSVEEPLIFQEMELYEQQPHSKMAAKMVANDLKIPVNFDRNFTNVSLSASLRQQVDNLLKELQEGEITELGFNTTWIQLYQKYLDEKNNPALSVSAKPSEKDSKSEKYPKKQIQDTGEQKIAETEKTLKRSQNDENPMINLDRSPYNERKGPRKLLNINVSPRLEEDGTRETERDMGDSEFLRQAVLGTEVRKPGSLPWERNNSLEQLQREKEKLLKTEDYVLRSRQTRNLLDTFGDSLRHVNRIYNKAFGFGQRKVPAHMPHMIDKHIMSEMQERFAAEWDETSSHKVRHARDMQFAFSYFYYLLGVSEDVSPEQIFDNVDTDHSRVLSDREIRTLAAQLYDLPLFLETLQGLEAIIVNCSRDLPDTQQNELPPPKEEVYYDADMPQVTRKLFLNCENLTRLIKEKFKPKPKYKYTILDDEEVVFKMIKSNVSVVVGQLDDIRKNHKKFICLNDNIEHGTEDAKTVKAILQDYYESMFPIPSQFELPKDYRNRFLHTDDLRDWKKYRDWLKFWTHLALVLLILFTIGSFFGDKIDAARRRLSRAYQRQRSSSSGSNNGRSSRLQDAIMAV